jgi:hypothetical protein
MFLIFSYVYIKPYKYIKIKPQIIHLKINYVICTPKKFFSLLPRTNTILYHQTILFLILVFFKGSKHNHSLNLALVQDQEPSQDKSNNFLLIKLKLTKYTNRSY